MNCRGDDARRYIVQNYNVVPTAHIKLLSGKKIPSDAGGDITDSYFMFRCEGRHGLHDEILYCGRPTAQKLCNMIHRELPPLFDPLKENYRKSYTSGDVGKSAPIEEKVKWNPERKQLYNAAMLIIAAWNSGPNTPICKVAEAIFDKKFIVYPPRDGNVKSVNTILTHTNTTMDEIIASLIRKGNDLKDFSFDLVVNHLVRLGIQQHFCKTE